MVAQNLTFAGCAANLPNELDEVMNREPASLSKLPAELRIMIYQEVLRQEPHLTIWDDRRNVRRISRPPLLSACKQVRCEAIDAYQQGLASLLSRLEAKANNRVRYFEWWLAEHEKAGVRACRRQRRRMFHSAFAEVEGAVELERLIEKEIASLKASGESGGLAQSAPVSRYERIFRWWNKFAVDHGYSERFFKSSSGDTYSWR